MDKPINVLIVDDELLVRQGLRSTIDWARYGMQVAGEAANGEAALDLYEGCSRRSSSPTSSCRAWTESRWPRRSQARSALQDPVLELPR